MNMASAPGKPFFKYPEEIEHALKSNFRIILVDGVVEGRKKDKKAVRKIDEKTVQAKYDEMISWLGESPKDQVFRVNTLQRRADKVIDLIKATDPRSELYQFTTFPKVPELIMVFNKESSEGVENKEINVKAQEAIVKWSSGSAILRGGHVFGPDIMGLSKSARKDMVVSVFVDTSGTCKPGATTNLQKPKKFLGNGVLITRDYAKYKGPVIKMMERITNSPSIDLNLIPPNFVRGQHFPSIICPRILDPKPDEVVLDISGYAGMETSHIAALMGNKGKVIALQRDAARIDQFTKRHKEFGCTNIRIFHLDFEKLVKQNGAKNIKDFDYRPPFPKGSFDRILVDADCSYLGLRPLIFYPQNGRSMASWQPRQKKLFTSAVDLLKDGGTLVYATCTVTIFENESIVAWALKTFPCLELISAREKYESFELREFPVSPGYTIRGFNSADAQKVLRFGPEGDSAGFFIALFRKTNAENDP